MENKTKYIILTCKSYPFGFDIKYFYLPIGYSFNIGDVITNKKNKRYQIIDGMTQVSLSEIDLNKYEKLEL